MCACRTNEKVQRNDNMVMYSRGLLCKQRCQKLVSRAPHEVYDILSPTGSGATHQASSRAPVPKLFSYNPKQLLLGNSVVVPIQPALRRVHHLRGHQVVWDIRRQSARRLPRVVADAEL